MRCLLALVALLFAAGDTVAQPADSVASWAGLRHGRQVESATGRFVVHVPDGWSVSGPTGEMLQGEILFRNEADSTYVSPQYVAADEFDITPLQFVNEFVSEMAPGPEYGMVPGPLRTETIDGRLVLSRRAVPTEPGRWGTLQISAIEAPGGFIMVVGSIYPGVEDDSLYTILRSIEICD